MNDTCFGINNEGGLVFNYSHEDSDQIDGANVYNGQNSTLWVNFRQAFPDKIKETYQDLRSNGVLNYDELIDQFITNGSDRWSESIYNEDGDFKYISMLWSDNDATNLQQVRGTGEEHLRYFLENRFNFCDSKWYAGDYPNDYVVLRIYTPKGDNLSVPADPSITITPYSHMYAGVRYAANGTLQQQRLSANETYTFSPLTMSEAGFNDLETAVYGASQLSSLGDLAPLYCGYIDVSKATKLTNLKIGDNTEGYSNVNLKELSVGTNKLLKTIDVRNCPSFVSALKLSGCPNIEEIYATGSGITGVELADSGYLKIIELPATIANLTLKNQLYIERLTLEGYSALKTLLCENCPTIDSLAILNNSPNLERARLTNVNWDYPNTDALYALMERDIAGIDENGTNTDTMWIDGKCHIETLTGNEFAEIKAAFPYLEITYTTLTSQLIFMSEDGTTELHRETIYNGGDSTDPVGRGIFETPTKESTAQYDFTFSGWSLTSGGDADSSALLKVELDRTVYVAYSKAIRSYTVNFYNGTLLLETYTIEYGSDAKYAGSTPIKQGVDNPEDFEFTGWNPKPTNIQGNTDCYAQYYDTRVITDDWSTIASNCLNGTATDKYEIGSYKTVVIGATELPYDFYKGCAVVYDDEIHILGGENNGNKKHYKFNGTEWTSVSTLPYNLNYGCVVIYNNEIHILGDEYWGDANKHYKWNGTTWISVSTLPHYLNNGCAVVYDNEIHILGSKNANTAHYKFNGTEWVSVSTLPYAFNNGKAIVYNNEIHILGAFEASDSVKHYKFNGTEWVSVSTLPYMFRNGSALVYNNEIHILGNDNSTNHYKWNGNTWNKISTLPYAFKEGFALSFNDKIHILGGVFNSDNYRSMYYLDDDNTWKMYGDYETIEMEVIAHNHDELVDMHKWKKTHDLPFTISSNGCSLLYHSNALYIVDATKGIYKYASNKWNEIATPPYTMKDTCVVSYKNEIHFLGGGNQYHYKHNGTEYVEVGTLPYVGNSVKAVVYNNILYAFFTDHFCKYDGTEWTELTSFSSSFNPSEVTAAIYNSQLYIVYSDNYHRSYNFTDDTWTMLEQPTYIDANGNSQKVRGALVVMFDELYMVNNTAIVKYNGSEWVLYHEACSACANWKKSGQVTVINNAISAIGGKAIMRLLAFESQGLGSTPNGGSNLSVFTYNDCVYIACGTTIYKYDGEEWTIACTLPDNLTVNKMILYDGNIYVYTNNDSTHEYYNCVLKYDWTEWSAFTTTTTGFDVSVCNLFWYENNLYVIGASNSYPRGWILRWNDGEWVRMNNTGTTLYSGYRSLYFTIYKNILYIYCAIDGRLYKTTFNIESSQYTLTPMKAIFPAGQYNTNDVRFAILDDILYIYNNENSVMICYDGESFTYYTAPNISRFPSFAAYRGKLYWFFGEGKTYGIISRPRATLTFLAKNLLKDSYRINNGNTNEGGWSNSLMRTYCNETILSLLPQSLQSALAETKKYSDGGYSNQVVVSSDDKLWIPSYTEVGGEYISSTLTDSVVKGQGDDYGIFTDVYSRRKSKLDDVNISWWLRTSSPYNNSANISISNMGNFEPISTGSAFGILFGFCLK